MENNKKIMLALGFLLTIMGSGASSTVLAMEQSCRMSPEIVDFYRIVATEMASLSTAAGIRLNNNPITGPDFLKKDPLVMLYHLQYAKDWLHIKLIITQSGTLVPGAIDPWDSMQYEQDYDLYLKVNRLFDLIKNACDITNEQINERKNKLSEEWKKEEPRWSVGR